jgi:hypothetical protein
MATANGSTTTSGRQAERAPENLLLAERDLAQQRNEREQHIGQPGVGLVRFQRITPQENRSEFTSRQPSLITEPRLAWALVATNDQDIGLPGPRRAEETTKPAELELATRRHRSARDQLDR